jgi:hypothetical protein
VTDLGLTKLQLAARHLPPALTSQYEHVFLWDGDALLDASPQFEPARYETQERINWTYEP